MDAVVIAGGIPNPEDPLYVFLKGDAKALVDVAGKPMIQWVLDALGGAKRVDNVILVGLSAKNQLTCAKPLYYVSNQGRMLSNIVAGVNKALELNQKTQYVLIVSSDIPALKSEMVDWLVDTCMETQDDFYYGICPRDVMEKRFPNSKRTYTKLKDMELCGSDINVLRTSLATEPEYLELGESLIGSRKSAVRQASMVGWDTAFQLLTRSITLDDLVEKASRRIGIKGRVIIWDHAEPCMDVDKPHQLEMLRMELVKEQRKTAARVKRAAPKTTKAPAKPKTTARATSTKKQPAAAKKVSKTPAKTREKAGK